MGYLYGRIIQLTVAGLRIKDLKLAFDIERKPNESVPGGGNLDLQSERIR